MYQQQGMVIYLWRYLQNLVFVCVVSVSRARYAHECEAKCALLLEKTDPEPGIMQARVHQEACR